MHVLIIFLAIAVVACWRVLLRLALALITIVVLVAIGTGVATLMHAGHL